MKRLVTILGIALTVLSGPADAVTDLEVRPDSVSIEIRLNVPPITADPSVLSSRPTFRELFEGRPLNVSLSPALLKLKWLVTCNGNFPAVSQQGEFRVNGSLRVTNNFSLTTSACNGTESIDETVAIPDALGEEVVKHVLDERVSLSAEQFTEKALRLALERAARNALSKVFYERVWQAVMQRSARVALTFRAKVVGRIRLDFSRLVSFDGSTSAGAVSVLRASAPVPVTWTGVVEQVGSGSTLTLTSDRFIIRSRSGTVLGQGASTFTRSGVRSGRVVFNETISLTSTQLLRARQSGGGIVLERTLSDDAGNSFTARVPVNLAGPTQSDFAVTAIKCRFHDGARTKIVREGDPVHVLCDLRFDGPGGLLRGAWETAEGGGGQLFFRTVELYSNFVVGQNVVQISRTFIASGTGRHIVRFRVQEPELLADQVTIQYYVGVDPDQVAAIALPAPLSVLNPPANSIAKAGLEIMWSRVPSSATHVLIEFFAPDQLIEEPDPNELEQRSSSLLVRGEPIAGLVVPSDRRSAELSELVIEHLRNTGRVYMRISALEEGVQVAVSPLRRLNTP